MLDVQLLHDRVLFSGGTLATSTVEQQTIKDITSSYNDLFFHSGKVERNEDLVALWTDS